MPLPVPDLDDRHFQDIVDHAKSLIPRYCESWTDHNVSDPGVALIELFAWMTDLLLYRVNQVPDKVYVTLLELIGVRLQPPRAAQAPVTFLLSAPQATAVTIREGTEVATVQTETSPAIIFSSEADLTIRPVSLLGAYTDRAAMDRGDSANARPDGDDEVTHDLERLAFPDQEISVFPEHPRPGDVFDLALADDHSQHVLGLALVCQRAGGTGVYMYSPPLEWQVWQGAARGWVPCLLDGDTTYGFNQPGEVRLSVPAMARGDFHGRNAYWLRCRLTDAQAGDGAYRVSPRVQSLRVESWGGMTSARHATVIHDEILGQSDGASGQMFKLLHTPILARDPRRDYLVVEAPAGQGGSDGLHGLHGLHGLRGEPERWVEVADFADSGPEDRHFTLDSLDGTLTLGPLQLQPDGSVYLFGKAPERDAVLRFSRYQHGGGAVGNLPRQALSVLKSSIPYVQRVENREAAVGGQDAQSLEDAKVRAPQALRARSRAVTADDYTYFAGQAPGIARAHCLGPGAQPGHSSDPQPGQVFVVALPQVADPAGPIPAERLLLTDDMKANVRHALETRQLLGITLVVREPQYTWVSVNAALKLGAYRDSRDRDEARRQAEAHLYRYLNPYLGGPQGHGWPFGRSLALSEVYGLLQGVPRVEFVDSVRIDVVEPGTLAAPRPVASTLTIPPGAVICSAEHRVQVN